MSLVCNVLVIMYCVIQYQIGGPEHSFLGIEELSLLRNKWDKMRITGPFNAVGITAEYFVIQILLLTYYVLNEHKYEKLILSLIFCNVAVLIGTGNRGGFMSFHFFFLLTFFEKGLEYKRL